MFQYQVPAPPRSGGTTITIRTMALAMRELAEAEQAVTPEALYLRGFGFDQIRDLGPAARERARMQRVRNLDGIGIGGQP